MSKESSVTIGEAAEMLGTTKERIARLISRGILTSRPSKLDARRRLIPREQVERILQAEGYRPPKKPRKPTSAQHPRPQTAELYTGPVTIHSDEVEEYLRHHWRAE